MELSNEFRVNAPIDEAWAVLTDIELIAPCLPGAQLTEVDGDTYSGQVKVKVGPITAQYKGSAVFSEKDDTNHRVVLDAKGRDTRGQGNASAEVTAQLTADGDAATNVAITTDLKLSGKVAQFGRGVLADVSEKLLGEFQVCLEGKLAAGATGGAAGGNGSASAEAPAGAGTDAGAAPSPGQGATTGPRRIEMPEPEPVDLLETAGAPVIKRVIPIVIVVLVLIFLLRRLRRS
jgi:carbon monoxide dehydrogenase subunit G